MDRADLDLEKPNYKSVIEFINGLAKAETNFKTPEEINMNRTKRLYMVNQLTGHK